MTTKVCFKCLVPKDLSEFYRHPMMGDGYLGKCKDCTRSDVASNRAAKAEYYLRYDRTRANDPYRVEARREYAASERGKERQAAGSSAWASRNPIKRAAQHAVNNAVRDGRLIKQPCEKCGCLEVEGHHDDYSRPLDVRWLCHAHHMEHHRNERNLPKVPDKALLRMSDNSATH